MILLHQKYGQMANRIILISHFIATSLDTNSKLKILNFEEYFDFFNLSKLDKHKLISFSKNPFLLKLIIPLVYRLNNKIEFFKLLDLRKLSLDHKLEFNIKDYVVDNKVKIIVPEGWGFRNHDGVTKHAEMIRSIFAPKEKTKKIMLDYKPKKSEILIGLHLRRGDYKDYLDGKYYYSFEEYLSLLEHILIIFEGIEHKIIIFSNENIPSEIGSKKNVVLGPSQVIDDFFVMSQCNYIIGPPSTFSLVASFLGQNKLYHIKDIKKKPDLSDFKLTGSI
jgi:hypothetical protein